MTDFNTLIPANSPLYVIECTGNNDLGQIVGIAVEISTGNTRGFVATPVNGDGPLAAAAGETLQRPHITLPENLHKLLQRRIRRMPQFVY